MMSNKRRQAGLSLLEIMVALSLGAFMLLGIISLMASVSTTRTELGRNSERIENGRYAVQILQDEIALAGYFGPYFRETVDGTDPDPCVTTLTSLGIEYNSGGAPKFPTAVSSYASAATKPSCFTTTAASIRTGGGLPDGEVLVVRRVDSQSLVSGGAVSGRPYLQFSTCAGQADFVFGDAGFTLSKKNSCSTAGSAEIWPYRVTSFFVSSCDDCASGDGIPTLKAVEYVSGGLQTVSLVEGVEDIHFEYGLDLNDDGAPDCYVPDPKADLSGGCPGSTLLGSSIPIENLENVVSVQASILVRSLDPFPGWSDTRTYDLGRADPVGPFNDSFKRQVFRSVIPLPNVSGVRE